MPSTGECVGTKGTFGLKPTGFCLVLHVWAFMFRGLHEVPSASAEATGKERGYGGHMIFALFVPICSITAVSARLSTSFFPRRTPVDFESQDELQLLLGCNIGSLEAFQMCLAVSR